MVYQQQSSEALRYHPVVLSNLPGLRRLLVGVAILLTHVQTTTQYNPNDRRVRLCTNHPDITAEISCGYFRNIWSMCSEGIISVHEPLVAKYDVTVSLPCRSDMRLVGLSSAHHKTKSFVRQLGSRGQGLLFP